MNEYPRKPLEAVTQVGAPPPPPGIIKLLGASVVTGAADDDPSAIGTYASAGAKYGLGFLWIAPVLFPMMYAVVYLSAKIGQVYGKGLFACIRDQFPRWVLIPMVILAFLWWSAGLYDRRGKDPGRSTCGPARESAWPSGGGRTDPQRIRATSADDAN